MSSQRTILVLHGYSQNAHIFSKRLGALRKQCGKTVEMVFVDAPMQLSPHDLLGSSPQQASSDSTSQNTLSALGAAEASTDDPNLQPRGWWKSDPTRTKMEGIENTLALLRDILKERTFDGVLGFSQGAGLAALLSALLERPEIYPPFLVEGKAPHPPFKFCVAVAGFRPRDKRFDALWEKPYQTPTLHIIGKNDIIVTEERAQQLVEVSGSPRVQFHEGGHFVPSKANWRVFLTNYLKNGPDNIPDLVPTAPDSMTTDDLQAAPEQKL
ncbi:FSH1-domain-containing protein [Flagelloscypha sp. PMI_526]|nr:FSH1-domain-containing protein [Flagelloscypha sp. PMI_526]